MLDSYYSAVASVRKTVLKTLYSVHYFFIFIKFKISSYTSTTESSEILVMAEQLLSIMQSDATDETIYKEFYGVFNNLVKKV